MTYQMNTPVNEKRAVQAQKVIGRESIEDTLTIYTETKRIINSAMPDYIKEKKRADAPSLFELFKNTIERKGEGEQVQIKELNTDEFFVEGLSSMTLQSFILKAEELGKNISYTTSLQVKISD